MAERPSSEERAARIAALKAQRATAPDSPAEATPARSAARPGRPIDWTTRVAVAGAATSAMFAMVTAFGLGANSVESAPAPAPQAAPLVAPATGAVEVGLTTQVETDQMAMGVEADAPAPTPVSRTAGSR